jgi:hypothetical protein
VKQLTVKRLQFGSPAKVAPKRRHLKDTEAKQSSPLPMKAIGIATTQPDVSSNEQDRLAGIMNPTTANINEAARSDSVSGEADRSEPETADKIKTPEDSSCAEPSNEDSSKAERKTFHVAVESGVIDQATDACIQLADQGMMTRLCKLNFCVMRP